MKKLIAAMNMTLDGFCDHTAGLPTAELHEHYAEWLGKADAILYGRITYQLMEYWRTVVENPSEEQFMNDFAAAIDQIPKVVFSRTLKKVNWKSAALAPRNLKDEVTARKQGSGRAILVGSRSLIIQLLNLNMLDELELSIHPVVVGKGLPLFENLHSRIVFELMARKTFHNGTLILRYKPIYG